MDWALNRRDVGYTIISRFEETLRSFLTEGLLSNFSDYSQGIPPAIIDKAKGRANNENLEELTDLLENIDFPDLKEICCFKKMYPSYFPQARLVQQTFA